MHWHHEVFILKRSAYTHTYLYMGASSDLIVSRGDPKVVQYSILPKMSDTIKRFLKIYLQVQICCICGVFFSEIGNF